MGIVALLLGSLTSAHAVPIKLSQQGRLLDSNGVAYSGSLPIAFRLYDSQLGGNIAWQEVLSVSFVNGYYTAILGADATNPLDNSVLLDNTLYLETEVNNTGPIGMRQPLMSAPYARIADTTHNLDGGSVDASEISVGGSMVIDSNGNWVGPTLLMNWADLQGIPSDLSDGDDDALSGLSCSAGQIVGWDGLAWVCAADNGLTEAEVEAYVTNAPIDLAAGSMVGSDTIVTISTDQDTLGALSCQSGDVPKWDAVLSSWGCDIDNDTSDWNMMANIPAGFSDGVDNDTTDWNALQNIPADLSDGDDVLNESDVESYIVNDSIDLAAGSTTNGQTLMTHVNCNNGEFLTYNNGVWECANISNILDSDADGVLAWEDCDDTNANIGASTNDNDCDGYDASIDCNDFDPLSETTATDGDCDGILTADDCDDNDATAGAISEDADCDGTLTADDCDDNDPTSTIIANDADCDGILTADDCDDNDPATTSIGSASSCPATSCQDVLDQNSAATDGVYWLAGNSSAYEAYCNMTDHGGGWTLVGVMTNADAQNWAPTSSYWHDSSVFGSAADPSQNADAKSAAWMDVFGDQVMIEAYGQQIEVVSDDQCFSAMTMQDLFRRDSQNDADCAVSCGMQLQTGPWTQSRTNSTLKFRCMDQNANTISSGGYNITEDDNSFITTLDNSANAIDYNFGLGAGYGNGNAYADFDSTTEDGPDSSDTTQRLLYIR